MTEKSPPVGGIDDGRQRAEALGLTPEVYSQLKRMAHSHLMSYRKGMTLNCTALVHEAFVKLNGNSANLLDGKDNNHFLATASLAMRHILVDYTRLKNAEKRGSGALHVTLQESRHAEYLPAVDLLELDEALKKLAQHDPMLEKLVVLRFFGGLTMDQVAVSLGRSPRSITRDWMRARAYLFRELNHDDG